ncbi:MAG: hypothetical protein GY730_10870, partial [bacterium]|nr:hypothetical protein [bacterium]
TEDLYFDWFSDNIEARGGLQIFSWKTVESYSNVDFLNQTDTERDLFDPEKIAELALRLRFLLPTENEQYLEVYFFPRFTTSRLPGAGNRNNLFPNDYYAAGSDSDFSGLGISSDYTVQMEISNNRDWMLYGSDKERSRPQFAVRYQTIIFDETDLSFFYFDGYERKPQLVMKKDSSILPVSSGGDNRLYMIHKYNPAKKAGFTFQGVYESLLYKGEMLYHEYE